MKNSARDVQITHHMYMKQDRVQKSSINNHQCVTLNHPETDLLGRLSSDTLDDIGSLL